VHDPTDPVGRLLFNVLAMVAEFESDLIRLRTKDGMRVAKAKGHLRGRPPKLGHLGLASHIVLKNCHADTQPLGLRGSAGSALG
jgi:DNA invertase Pin-like site-specific DNA recombinase